MCKARVSLASVAWLKIASSVPKGRSIIWFYVLQIPDEFEEVRLDSGGSYLQYVCDGSSNSVSDMAHSGQAQDAIPPRTEVH